MRSRTVAVVIAGTLVMVGAAATAATVLRKDHFKGKYAFAVCRMSQPIDCGGGFSGELTTSIFVEGSQAMSRSLESPDERYNLALATVVQDNTCTGELNASFGRADDGFKAWDLKSAEIHGSLPLEGFEGGSFGTLDIDLDVKAFGDTQTSGDHIRFDFETEEGPYVVSIKFSDRSRSATASGTVVLDGNAVPCSFGDAGIVDTKSGSRETQH